MWGSGAAAIKEVKFVPEKMLIPPLCEQLIGRLLVRARRLRFWTLPAWRGVRHRPHRERRHCTQPRRNGGWKEMRRRKLSG